MRRWRKASRASGTGRKPSRHAAARPERARRSAVEGLESRQLLAATGIREYPIPTLNSAPFWITQGSATELFFTAAGANQIGGFNLSSHGFTAFPTASVTIGSNSFITTGADGNLYFTASAANAIVRFNPSSTAFQPFTIPTQNVGPNYITSGPDGNLYFTATGANVIEQLNPTSLVFTTFTIPTDNAGAGAIITGPNNNLWFLETSANKLAELNPTTHVITELPLPVANSGATFLAFASNGDLYFTEPGANALGQFDPTTRVFQSFPIPVLDSGAGSITQGADGNLYFTEPGVNQIGQFNPGTRQFKQFVIPTANSNPGGIISASDGNVYFTETGGNNIGQLVIGSQPPPPPPPHPQHHPGVVVIRPKIETNTTLTATPNPSVVGETVTLTATVTIAEAAIPTGTVTFFIDGQPQRPVHLSAPNGVAQATFFARLGSATHVITAVYNGNKTYTASTSDPVSVVVAPAPGDGPTVVRLSRIGVHAAPTTLVLNFSDALDPTTAQNLDNYRITSSGHRSIRISSVAYNPSTFTVTISPAVRLNVHRVYQLTVNGTTSTGITDTAGNLLDGAFTGHPGSNFVATVSASNLLPPSRANPR